jgi:agmatine deiminase
LTLAGADLSNVEFFRFLSNRGWTRDSGPLFILRDTEPAEAAVINFQFNAWARYRDWQHDARIHRLAAKALGLRLFRPTLRNLPVVLEGGAIDGNGRGTVLTTEECLLDQETQVRNPGISRGEMQLLLREYLGATNVLWLGRGIAGDDTHGHVDDLCRFVNPRTLVLCREVDPTDENYRNLEENRERLEGMKLEDGSRPEILFLPMPKPLFFSGRRLPASYANFYICNGAVIVPTFNDPHDRIAIGMLQDVFPGRTVVGIHAVDLVWGFGTLHCLTHEQPAVPAGPR